MIKFTKQSLKEIESFPEPIREDLADALARLETGLNLSMPLSRPMPSIAKAVHELRLKDKWGSFRFVYALIVKGDIYVLLGFHKKTQTTPSQIITLAQKRLKDFQK